MARKRGLSKGLDALLGSSTPAEEVPITPGDDPVEIRAADGELKHLPVEFLQRGRFQPRRDIHPEKLEELSESIKAQGVMQPIVVRPVGENSYEIIAGERRWRASQMAQLESVPCVVRDVPDEAAIAMALIENIQREDLNPMEEAYALQRLKEEFELSHQQVAEAVGKSRATVTNLLRLTSLADPVKKLLEHGDIEMGHARALLSLPEDKQIQTANEVANKELSVRQTEALVRKIQEGAKPSQVTTQAAEDPDVKRLKQELSDKLAAPVELRYNSKGKGKLVISYNSFDELEGILNHLR